MKTIDLHTVTLPYRSVCLQLSAAFHSHCAAVCSLALDKSRQHRESKTYVSYESSLQEGCSSQIFTHESTQSLKNPVPGAKLNGQYNESGDHVNPTHLQVIFIRLSPQLLKDTAGTERGM